MFGQHHQPNPEMRTTGSTDGRWLTVNLYDLLLISEYSHDVCLCTSLCGLVSERDNSSTKAHIHTARSDARQLVVLWFLFPLLYAVCILPRQAKTVHTILDIVTPGVSQPRPLNRFLRVIRQTTRFRARMCLFRVRKQKFNIYTP